MKIISFSCICILYCSLRYPPVKVTIAHFFAHKKKRNRNRILSFGVTSGTRTHDIQNHNLTL